MCDEQKPRRRLTVRAIVGFYSKERSAKPALKRANKTRRKIRHLETPHLIENSLQPGRWSVALCFQYDAHGANEQDIDQFILSLSAATPGEEKHVINVRGTDWILLAYDEFKDGQWVPIS